MAAPAACFDAMPHGLRLPRIPVFGPAASRSSDPVPRLRSRGLVLGPSGARGRRRRHARLSALREADNARERAVRNRPKSTLPQGHDPGRPRRSRDHPRRPSLWARCCDRDCRARTAAAASALAALAARSAPSSGRLGRYCSTPTGVAAHARPLCSATGSAAGSRGRRPTRSCGASALPESNSPGPHCPCSAQAAAAVCLL